jgi:hypothetical protein
MQREPVSLSDDAMTMIMKLTAPLVPQDRTAFMNSLAVLLRSEPAQPPGDGIVYRHARALLSSGSYRRADSLAVGGSARPSWHNSASKLRAGRAIGASRSK